MINRLARMGSFPLLLRVSMLFGFLGVLVLLKLESITIFGVTLYSSLPMLIIWTLWWPLLYLTVPFVGRGWCGFLCPLGLVAEQGDAINKGWRYNFVRWSFIPYIITLVVIFVEQASGMFISPQMTLLFFGGSLVLVMVTALLWRRQLFCRLLCPIGTLMGLFSRLSVVGLRTKRDLCKGCTSKECLMGTSKAGPCPQYNFVPGIISNRDCLICTNCIKNCPHESAAIQLISPFKEISAKETFSIHESLFIISLLGVLVILTTPGTKAMRAIADVLGIGIIGPALRGVDFLLVLGIGLASFFLVSLIAMRWRFSKLKEHMREAGYLYLPLLFSIMAYTIVIGFLGPYLPLGEKAKSLLFLVAIAVGAIWSASWLLDVAKTHLARASQGMYLSGIVLLWVGFLSGGPLALYEPGQAMFVANPSQVINMDAYSMAFEPGIISVPVGQQVVLNITSTDIDHAIDIDEFGVHQVIKGGVTTRVLFTPDKTGEFTIYCSIPGHTEAGMTATLIVREED